MDEPKTNLSANFKASPEENRGARTKYEIHIMGVANKTAKREQELLSHDEPICPLWWKEHHGNFLKSFHSTVKNHKAGHDDGVRFPVKSRSLQYHEADKISLPYDRERSDFAGTIGESLQYNLNLQQKCKLLQDKTTWQALGDLSQPVFRRFLKMIRCVDMNTPTLVIIALLLVPSVEAMPPGGILDKPPDHSHDTRWIAWAVRRLLPSIALVEAVRQGNNLRRVQDGASAFRSWLSRMCETVFGLLMLLHCVAWVVIVGLMDQGRSDLLQW